MREAFALQVYRKFLSGQTVQQLSAELGIPAERISQRIRAAQRFWASQRRRAA